MNRSERRHRTEVVRARRINLYGQIDTWHSFKSENSHANYIQNRGWRSRNIPDHKVLEELREDREERIVLEAKMRNEYITGYRDNDWVNDGREQKMKIADYDFWSWLAEVGVKDAFRIRTKRRYYNCR